MKGGVAFRAARQGGDGDAALAADLEVTGLDALQSSFAVDDEHELGLFQPNLQAKGC